MTEKSKLNELQIRVLAIAKVLSEVEVKGPDNMKRILSSIKELEDLSTSLGDKKQENE